VGASRYVIIGNTCAGKSTLAVELARRLSLELVELDALHWKPNWEPRATEDFHARVSEATHGSRWVVAGDYSSQRDISWPRADVVVWLDAGLAVTMWRVLKRTYQRYRSREMLWGTNRERFWPLLKVWNQHESLLAWAIRQHGRKRQAYAAMIEDQRWEHLRFVRLRSGEEVRLWVEEETRKRT
jgi:adenylate kinase family enzyme